MMQVDAFLRLIESVATAIVVLLLVAVSLIAHILIVVKILCEEFVQFRIWWIDFRRRHSGC